MKVLPKSTKLDNVCYDIRGPVMKAAKQIEAFGHEPINPFDNGLAATASWEECMVADISMLFKCKGIYMINGWESSRGARIENFIAKESGLAIYNQPEI